MHSVMVRCHGSSCLIKKSKILISRSYPLNIPNVRILSLKFIMGDLLSAYQGELNFMVLDVQCTLIIGFAKIYFLDKNWIFYECDPGGEYHGCQLHFYDFCQEFLQICGWLFNIHSYTTCYHLPSAKSLSSEASLFSLHVLDGAFGED